MGFNLPPRGPKGSAQNWQRALEIRRQLFALGVNAARNGLPTLNCDGCGKTMTALELAGVTPFGALCVECYGGTR